MECVRVYQNELGDLEFEFVCPECGYREIISLFDAFARGDFFVSHMHEADGSSYLSINFQTEEAEIPRCFREFFESLDDNNWPDYPDYTSSQENCGRASVKKYRIPVYLRQNSNNLD